MSVIRCIRSLYKSRQAQRQRVCLETDSIARQTSALAAAAIIQPKAFTAHPGRGQIF